MDYMATINNAIIGLADEVTLNPDIVTENAIDYGKTIIDNKDHIDDLNMVESMLYEISEYGKWQQRVYILSLLAHFTQNSKYLAEIIDYLNNNFDDISLSSLNYIMYQIGTATFIHSSMDDRELAILKWKLYDRIMDKYVSFFSDDIKQLDGKTREEFVVIFTEQLLRLPHAPTKMTLDRAKILIERQGKKVLVINTAELDTCIGRTPFCNERIGNYLSELSSLECIEYDGVKIPYLQLLNNMPETNAIRELINVLSNNRPAYAISIGGGNVVVSLVAKMIPVLTIPMVSSITATRGMCQSYVRDVSEDDKKLLEDVGRDENHIIKSMFSFSVTDIKEKKSKKALGLNKEDFVVVLVGNRIEKEVTQEYWLMLEKCKASNLQVLVVGCNQDDIAPYTEKFVNLKNRVHCSEFQEDLRGYMCAADLYVNPKRMGGGSSAVEAMSIGVPVVSLNYGDVAINIGEDFVVESYDEMSEIIDRYSQDEEFYNKQSQKAVKRAEQLLDVEGTFIDLINEFEKRISN